ncbi:MAG: type II toxin-antitoxin system prevent-host-death family antitoxin [Gemmatimonadetes bacterium]|nr:type II toxin-antitoxin system prevent-host-death family antitoxin [Gemmatimonadota bacterium]
MRELKARLSEYLERAARGEIIRVTERGRPKAILAPLPGRLRLDEGIADGWVRPAAARPQGSWRRFRASRPVADMLAEDRGA